MLALVCYSFVLVCTEVVVNCESVGVICHKRIVYKLAVSHVMLVCMQIPQKKYAQKYPAHCINNLLCSIFCKALISIDSTSQNFTLPFFLYYSSMQLFTAQQFLS